MPKIAVIGLGRFGMALARHLARGGAEVIAIDSKPNLISEISDDVDLAVRLDATDEAALRSQGVPEVEIAVVAIGEDFEAGLLATVLLQRLGVVRVICRAQTPTHAQIFKQIGVTEVIQPESQAGENLAHRLANENIANVITLAKGFSLIEMVAPKQFVGETLQSIGLRQKYEVNLVAIKRGEIKQDNCLKTTHEHVIPVPKPTDRIEDDDLLVLVGSDHALSRLPSE